MQLAPLTAPVRAMRPDPNPPIIARDLVGVVKSFADNRGYGFITLDRPLVLPDGSSATEAFLHFTQLQVDGYKTVNAGQRVTLDAGTYPTSVGGFGIFAMNVRPGAAAQAIAAVQQLAS